jgi:hypothetical protein
MDIYQKETDYHNGAIRLTIDEESTVIRKLPGHHTMDSVEMTRHQAHQIVQFLKEGLQQIERNRTDESNEALNTLYHLLNALEILQSIDHRALTIPGVVEMWKQTLQQGWQAQSALESILEGWQRTLQQSTDAFSEKSEE